MDKALDFYTPHLLHAAPTPRGRVSCASSFLVAPLLCGRVTTRSERLSTQKNLGGGWGRRIHPRVALPRLFKPIPAPLCQHLPLFRESGSSHSPSWEEERLLLRAGDEPTVLGAKRGQLDQGGFLLWAGLVPSVRWWSPAAPHPPRRSSSPGTPNESSGRPRTWTTEDSVWLRYGSLVAPVHAPAPAPAAKTTPPLNIPLNVSPLKRSKHDLSTLSTLAPGFRSLPLQGNATHSIPCTDGEGDQQQCDEPHRYTCVACTAVALPGTMSTRHSAHANRVSKFADRQLDASRAPSNTLSNGRRRTRTGR
jgi:hypothetical protein